MGRHFSQTVLGFEEIMVNNPALKYLGLSPSKRDVAQIYFNIDMIR
jgi:hypothetical protein